VQDGICYAKEDGHVWDLALFFVHLMPGLDPAPLVRCGEQTAGLIIWL